MADTIAVTANWATGNLSNSIISRQYDNNRYRVEFTGYPEDGTENLIFYLLVFMRTEENPRGVILPPVQLSSDQWLISNYFTQLSQQIRFQLCVQNEAGTFEAHSPIFKGTIVDSLDHVGEEIDIDTSALFDAYREYINQLIIAAGAVVIDNTLTMSGAAADAKAVGDAIKTVRSFVVHVPGSAAVFEGNITAGDFAKALATYTAGSDVSAVKDGEVYQLSAAGSSTMTFTQMYHGTMNIIKQLQITSADTFTVTNTALPSSAADTSYNNTSSGLTATNVQAAIDENAAAVIDINGRLRDLKEGLSNISTISKNLLPIAKKETVINGVTVTYEDGTFKMLGTATSNGGRVTKLTDVFTLPAGTYTFWSAPNTGLGSLYIQMVSGNTIVSACNNNTTGTFTLDAQTELYIGYNFTDGNTYDSRWDIQVEAGTAKTEMVKPSFCTAVDNVARTLSESNTVRIQRLEDGIEGGSTLTFTKNGNDFSVVTKFNGADMTLTGFVTQSDKDNPAFDFGAYSGSFSKVAQDDIAPVFYNGSYRCGGHGNNVVMNLTASNHGLTEADIGKSYTLDEVAWILLKIVDSSHVWVISDVTNVPTRPFITTMPTSGTLVGNDGNIVYTTKSTIQLLPNNIKRKYAIYGDGEEITEDGTYTLEKLELAESYQSLDCVAMVEYLKTHIGSNTNTTYYSDDRKGELLYETVYTLQGDSCCVISQTLTALRDNLDMSFAGFTQVQAYSNTAYVPFTELAIPATVSGTTLNLTSDMWDSADFPPYKYYELDSNKSLGFVCGYDISFGMGKPEVRKVNTGGNAGNYNGTSAKIYPKFYGDGQVMTKGAKISGTAFRRPVVYKDNLITYTWSHDDSLFIEIEIFTSGTYTIDIDSSVVGKNVEIVKASDTLHLTNMVIAYPQLTIVASSAGSATLKIHN